MSPDKRGRVSWKSLHRGDIWAAVLIPVPIQRVKMARRFAQGGAVLHQYWTLGRIWRFLEVLATIIPLVNLYRMVFKPA